MSAEDKGPVGLGDKVRDVLTGFVGIAIGKTNWIHGCDRIIVEPDTLDDEGQPRESQTFDEQRIEVVARDAVPLRGGFARPGIGPSPLPLGSRARDTINGFEGILVAWTQWFTGADHYTIEPDTLDENGSPRDSHAAESQRVELVRPGPVPVTANAVNARPGGPQRGERAAVRRR